jgi:hypothetical protein
MRSVGRWPLVIGMIVIACADAPRAADGETGGGHEDSGAWEAGAEGGAAGQSGATGGNAADAGAGGRGGNGGVADAGRARTCAWVKMVTAGERPSPRKASLVYDAPRRQMLLLAGRSVEGSALRDTDDLWALALSGEPTWTRIEPRLPAPTLDDDLPYRGHGVVDGHQLIVVTRATNGGVWSLDLANPAEWHVVPSEDERKTVPTFPLAYTGEPWLDEPGRRLVLYSGFAVPELPPTEPYQMRLSHPAVFADLSPPPAPLFYAAHPIYDAPRRRLVVYGDSMRPPYDSWPNIWELSLLDPPTWSNVPTIGAPVITAKRGEALYDPIGQRMLVFALSQLDHNGNFGGAGGQAGGPLDGGEDLTVRVFTLSLASQAERWRLLDTTAGPRWLGQSIVYDEGQDRVLLFGGNEPPYGSAFGNDVWSLELAACR